MEQIPAPTEANTRSIYSQAWDWYIRSGDSFAGYEWPGDEWGSPESWEEIFQQLFLTAGVTGWTRAVEIGPGSGKYSLKVLARSQTVLRAYDVSAEFLKICERRCAALVSERRLTLSLLDTVRPDTLLNDLQAAGWDRKLDAFYSIDAMVHVDLQHLIVYLLTSALVLRQGGRLILTLADPTTPLGFTRLLEDIRWTFPLQNGPSAKFEWLTRDLIRSILTRLGFAIDLLFDNGRDLHLVATLTEPQLSEGMRHHITIGANQHVGGGVV